MEEILKIAHLKKLYGKKEVLKEVNLTLFQGECLALVGVNGGGKSTLLEIICGVKKANSGEIITSLKMKKNIGYMPQKFSLFQDLTVQENLNYLAVLYHLNKADVDAVIKKCLLVGRENYLARNLSGGYKQLLSLAGAIIFQPKLLILDEPTSAMDPFFRANFQKIITEYIQNGGSCILSTHYMDEITYCDKVAVLSGGEIVCCDTIKNVLKNEQVQDVSQLIINYYNKKGESYVE